MTETALRVEPLDSRPGDGLRLVGEVDITNVGRLRAALAAVGPLRDVHLDLSGLAFIDIAGTRTLVSEAAGRSPATRVVLHRPPYVLRRIMDTVWGPVPSIEVAGS